jgi:hypothetical protein
MRAALLIASVGLAACEPRAGVTMTASGGGYEMHFENCTRPGQTLPVQRVEVRRATAGPGELHCTFERSEGQAVSDSWRYGQAVPGYDMRGCGAFDPGESYEIRVSLGPVAADAEFTVGPDGKLEWSSGGCP